MNADNRTLPFAVAGGLLVAMTAWAAPDAGPEDVPHAGLRFSMPEGLSQNHFVRQNGVSAHLHLQTTPRPRIIVAFPAGNSGAALFFGNAGHEDRQPVWGQVGDLQVIARTDAKGRTLHGIQVDIEIAARRMVLEEADVGSIRFLRKAVDYSKLPARAAPDVHIDGDAIRFSRERPDGQSSYLLEVRVLAGQLRTTHGLELEAGAGGNLKLRVLAASGDPLEAPVAADRLLTERAASNPALERALAFLAYERKMLAGSWRFLTYFGRDTLLSIRLLMPVLTAEAADIGLGSVLERINARGEVAHEEEIGELAVQRNIAERGQATAEPVYDYQMVDDNLMLAPVLGAYIGSFGLERARRLLSGRTSAEVPFKSQLVKNLRLVVQQAQAFADEPRPANLVSIKKGLHDGNWRDSREGLVGGRYPYDVNAVLMPAALRAAAGIVGSGLLGDAAADLPRKQELDRMATVWAESAAPYFRVSIAPGEARDRLSRYAREQGYPPVDIAEQDVIFYAVALDAGFEPIPVMHSDTGFDLLFLQRPERYLRDIVPNLARPFPAGLSTPVGVLAANPVFAGAEAQALVTRNHYHGTVVWSWQQAMMIAGLDAQLRRPDLSGALKEELLRVRRDIWRSITASKEIINSELWSFALQGDEFVIAPFGQSAGHLTESNAVQLWSTVFLALEPASADQARRVTGSGRPASRSSIPGPRGP